MKKLILTLGILAALGFAGCAHKGKCTSEGCSSKTSSSGCDKDKKGDGPCTDCKDKEKAEVEKETKK